MRVNIIPNILSQGQGGDLPPIILEVFQFNPHLGTDGMKKPIDAVFDRLNIGGGGQGQHVQVIDFPVVIHHIGLKILGDRVDDVVDVVLEYNGAEAGGMGEAVEQIVHIGAGLVILAVFDQFAEGIAFFGFQREIAGLVLINVLVEQQVCLFGELDVVQSGQRL